MKSLTDVGASLASTDKQSDNGRATTEAGWLTVTGSRIAMICDGC